MRACVALLVGLALLAQTAAAQVLRLAGAGVMTPNNPIVFTDIVVPGAATRIDMVVDRSLVLARSDHDLIQFKFELSLDGGSSWGGGFLDHSVVPPVSYSMVMTCGASAGMHGNVAVISQNSSCGQALPPDQGAGRLARVQIFVRSAADVGIRVNFQ